jgi:prolyl oligopeptidase
MDWVLEQNDSTRTELRTFPGYQSLYDNTLEILTSTARIAYPSIRGDMLFNFWTDSDHPRGIYRRTTWESYLSGDPEWEVVLDLDALVAAEGTPWAFRGMNCLLPEERMCLVSLSPGGSDAVEVREFDLGTMDFVQGGFTVPVSKNSTAWVDENTILVSHNLNEEYVTTSGYSRAARRWERATGLEDASIIAEAGENDMGVFVATQETSRGQLTVVARLITIFETEYQFLENGELVSERSTINGISATKDYLLVNQLTEVQGQLFRYWREGGRWASEGIETPLMGAVGIRSSSVHHNRFFFTFDSFTKPTTLFLAEEDGTVREVRTLPDQYSAEGLLVEQHQASSPDGTQVPYFVVRAENAPMDGTNPTLLTAYGGFQISSTPSYLGPFGKGWVEGGGVYVLGNIRGGGEFGPSWWKAALKENRQRAYDDFIAVGDDLVARGITSPEHLGIMGASNGGLLVGAALTQRPDLYNAVVVQVPLLDMKRYHMLLAGASWMAEYGDPDIPEEWEYISRYSPYQNVRQDADYPRPFIFTTTRDDRVHPGHARKMAALMKSYGHDVLYFENVEGGHGAGVTPEQRAEAMALMFSYLHLQLGEG